MSDLENNIVNTMDTINNQISSITALPGVQEINKAGLFSLLCGGAQLTSTSILLNTVPPQNAYQGSRIWSNFVYFNTPQWEQNLNSTKYIVVANST